MKCLNPKSVRRCNFFVGSIVLVVSASLALNSRAKNESQDSNLKSLQSIGSPAFLDMAKNGKWMLSGQPVTFEVDMIDELSAQACWDSIVAGDQHKSEERTLQNAGKDFDPVQAVSFAPEILEVLHSLKQRRVNQSLCWYVGEFSDIRIGILACGNIADPRFLSGVVLFPDNEETTNSMVRRYILRPARLPAERAVHSLLPSELLSCRIASRWNRSELTAEVHVLDERQMKRVLKLLSNAGWRTDADFQNQHERRTHLYQRNNELLCLIASYEPHTEKYSVVTSLEIQ